MTENSEIADLKAKLARALSGDGGKNQFDDDDMVKIKRLILFLDRIDAFGFLAKYLFYALLAAGAILANMDRIIEWWKTL